MSEERTRFVDVIAAAFVGLVVHSSLDCVDVLLPLSPQEEQGATERKGEWQADAECYARHGAAAVTRCSDQ